MANSKEYATLIGKHSTTLHLTCLEHCVFAFPSYVKVEIFNSWTTTPFRSHVPIFNNHFPIAPPGAQ